MTMFTDKDGIVRWDTKKQYTREELAKQRQEFEEQAKAGKTICLTDLIGNHEDYYVRGLK